MTLYTRLAGAPAGSRADFAPGLLYHKWHTYDGDGSSLQTKESRTQFLMDVALAVNGLTGGARATVYRDWFHRYDAALRSLSSDAAGQAVEADTAGRLVVGFATNPALETGIALHPFLGFPNIPGSAVRGLVRHVAEMSLLAGKEEWEKPETFPFEAERTAFLDDLEQLHALLGSVSIEPHQLAPEGDPLKSAPRSPLPPRTLLRRWLERTEAPRLTEAETRRARALLGPHSGGLVTFYDAVPLPDQKDLLELDLLNPHYPEYYDSFGNHPPSDDQNPRPIYFLAVRSLARFLFPFRLHSWPTRPPRDDAESARIQNLRGLTPASARTRLTAWLRTGLSDHGAGAKTAAGYGYFNLPADIKSAGRAADSPGSATRPSPAGAPKNPPSGPRWELLAARINMGNADHNIPILLASLEGEPRRQAARWLLDHLKRNLKDPKHRNKPWALDLRSAADAGDS
jgi:CRISPR type III-B/RAMP module RAMP protein Cmr6